MTNPLLGVFYHWLGGLASASFYLFYRPVKKWSWETYWLVGGFFSWIIAPMGLAYLLVPNLWSTIQAAAPLTIQVSLPGGVSMQVNMLLMTYIFGILWGFGGLTYGLTMRYLGLALGMAVVLGFCAAFGTLVPPLLSGQLATMVQKPSGLVILAGVATCLAGIGVSGMAGTSKEKELSDEEKKAAIKEFNFGKGMLVATFSGVMSACFSYGLQAGKPLGLLGKASLKSHGGSDLWQNLPVLVVILWGGFTTNFIWCVLLNIKNRTGHEYLNLRRSAVGEVSIAEGMMLSTAPEEESLRATGKQATEKPTGAAPLLPNYFFSALAGTCWYMQFFFYSMGQTKMGKYDFSSWTLHMASIIIFGTLWGIWFKEWKGTSKRTHTLVWLGLFVLVSSTVVVGWGNYIAAQEAKAAPAAATH
jgi:L-rhamnose-H+ transport protein